jgi:phage-related protein
MMLGFSWKKYNAVRCLTTLSRCRPFGRGVEEIRVGDESGIYRVIYTARLEAAFFVLHAFQKKTQAAAKGDIDLARARYEQITRESK